jgi:hypothetical protein
VKLFHGNILAPESYRINPGERLKMVIPFETQEFILVQPEHSLSLNKGLMILNHNLNSDDKEKWILFFNSSLLEAPNAFNMMFGSRNGCDIRRDDLVAYYTIWK